MAKETSLNLEQRLIELLPELEIPTSQIVKVGEHTEYVSWDWRDNTTERVDDYASVGIPGNIKRVEAARREIIEIGGLATEYLLKHALMRMPYSEKYLKCLAATNKEEAKAEASRLYDREVSEKGLSYDTLCVIACNELRDWKFEDLPQVMTALESCYRAGEGGAMENPKIQQIFYSIYNNGSRPEVVDFIKSKIKHYEFDRLLVPALGMIANDEAVDFLIEGRKGKRVWRFDEYTEALKIAASRGSKKANEYIFKNSNSPSDIYHASRQMGRGKTRSLLSAIVTIPKIIRI